MSCWVTLAHTCSSVMVSRLLSQGRPFGQGPLTLFHEGRPRGASPTSFQWQKPPLDLECSAFPPTHSSLQRAEGCAGHALPMAAPCAGLEASV